jgi:hypothetical protein
VEIHDSARRHGVGDEDIRHAVANAMVIEDQDDDTRLYLGAGTAGALLEVLTIIRDDGTELAIHAMHPSEVPPTACRGVTMPKKDYGKTKSGRPITDELIAELADQAEVGYDVDEILRRRGGRPPMGSSAASVESVRLDPELSEALRKQAEKEGRTNSDVIREALRKYLRPTG